jgi:hypothetical protein
MSDQPIPEPIPLASGPFDPANAQPAPAQRPRCRALTVDGHRCKKHVLGGLHLCYSHYRNRRPALPEPCKVSVPLLEDRSAIQLMTTQILHGILSHRLDPIRARVALYALRITALTLPRPAAPPRSQAEDPEPSRAESSESVPAQSVPADQVVCRLGRDHEDFISADSDLADPPLNPACSVPESVEAVRELLDTLEPSSHCHPELEVEDMPHPDPTHDYERCRCFTCADYRGRFAEWMEQARVREAAGG